MNLTEYMDKSASRIQWLYQCGLGPETLMKIGAFIVTYGLFETSLERAIWILKRENVDGARPSTEKMKSQEWFDTFAAGRSDLSQSCNAVLKMAGESAANLADYRNSLVHGQLVSISGTAWFERNTQWFGAKRNKSPGTGTVEEPFLDLAIASASVLNMVAIAVGKLGKEAEAEAAIEQLAEDVRRVKSYAVGLRYDVDARNHEKY